MLLVQPDRGCPWGTQRAGPGVGPRSAVSPPRCTGPPLRLRRTLICVEPVQANETDVALLASLQFTLEARFPVMTTTASQAVSSTWER